MDKRVGLAVLMIVLLIGGGVTYLIFASGSKEPSQKVTQDTSNSLVDSSRPTESQSTSMPGEYVDYKEGVVAETSGTILLFFHAPWCPQCRALESDIKAKGVPDGVKIIKVDYDSNQKIRQEYGVTIQTTVVRVNRDGKQIEKFVAYDEPSLAAVVKELL